MVKSLLNFIDKFKAIIGYVSAFAGLVGIVIGAYVYLEGIPKRAEASNIQTQYVVKAYADTTFFLINRIESSIYSQGYRLDNLKASYVNHLKTDNKLDELIKYFEATQAELKKNGTYLFPIVQK
jgi:hypothetical protein